MEKRRCHIFFINFKNCHHYHKVTDRPPQVTRVLQSWVDPTIIFYILCFFSTAAINRVFWVIWLTNRVFWVTNRVFWIIYIECFKSCGVDLFHVLRFLQTYSMFSHPGWQDSTICGDLVTAPFVIAIVIICVPSECGPQGMTWNLYLHESLTHEEIEIEVFDKFQLVTPSCICPPVRVPKF